MKSHRYDTGERRNHGACVGPEYRTKRFAPTVRLTKEVQQPLLVRLFVLTPLRFDLDLRPESDRVNGFVQQRIFHAKIERKHWLGGEGDGLRAIHSEREIRHSRPPSARRRSLECSPTVQCRRTGRATWFESGRSIGNTYRLA